MLISMQMKKKEQRRKEVIRKIRAKSARTRVAREEKSGSHTHTLTQGCGISFIGS